MENQTMRRYVVTLKKGVDYDSFYHDMETVTDNIPHIPNRAVAIATWLPHSSRNTYYLLSDAEAYELKNDSRVLEVAIPAEDDPSIVVGCDTEQTGNFNKPSNETEGGQGNYKNWGLLRSAYSTNIYGAVNPPSTNKYPYHVDGTGVDVVIFDSGIDPDHPEWQDAFGVSRLQKIDWLDESGEKTNSSVSLERSAQSPLFYRDLYGHGTHVASTVAGKTFGWAKNARIYSMKGKNLAPDNDVTSTGASTAYDILVGLNLVRLWHINKPVDAVTGLKRPTVVNHSWGTTSLGITYDSDGKTVNYTQYKKINRGQYRGQLWYGQSWPGTTTLGEDPIDSSTGNELFAKYGLNFPTPTVETRFKQSAGLPGQNTAYDAEMEDLLDAGVHNCVATGNHYTYCTADPTDPNYNNWVESIGYPVVGDYTKKLRASAPLAEGDTTFVGTPYSSSSVALNLLLNVGDKIGIIPGGLRTAPKQLSDYEEFYTVPYYTVTRIVDTNTVEFTPGFRNLGKPVQSKYWLVIPTKYYYNRPSSPHAANAIKVSSISTSTGPVGGVLKENAADFSNRGPATTVWAAGHMITAAWPQTQLSGSYSYYENRGWRQRCISGTSMATPQVTGVVALYLQLNPGAGVEEVKNFIINSSLKNMLYSKSTTNYADPADILGAPNRLLYFPYANSTGLGADVTLTGVGGSANNLKIAPMAYTYANWAVDYNLSDTEKLLGINITDSLYLSNVNLGFQYQIFNRDGNLAFKSMQGTITSSTTQTTITGLPSTVGFSPGMVITTISGGTSVTGTLGASAATVVSVDSATQLTISSSVANTAGFASFLTPIPILGNVYGLNRKPDTAGLEYWTRRCLKTAYTNSATDTWTAGDYQSTAFKKIFCDTIFAGPFKWSDRINFYYPGNPKGGYWTNGDFIDKGIKP